MGTNNKQHLLDDLAREVGRLRDSHQWRSYLAAQAKFHHYSPRNVLLITMQHPTASQVAGFTTWQALGRSVKRGERAISILAPLVRAKPEGEEKARIGFRWVSVFDIDQTEGADLPSPVRLLDGNDPSGMEEKFARLAQDLGFVVTPEILPEGINGELRWTTSTIAVHSANPPLQRIKTIAHELGHALLHHNEHDRRRAEMEAESVAFVVLKSLGIDSSPYSAGYVASWIADYEEPNVALMACCSHVQAASSTILEGLKRHNESSVAA